MVNLASAQMQGQIDAYLAGGTANSVSLTLFTRVFLGSDMGYGIVVRRNIVRRLAYIGKFGI